MVVKNEGVGKKMTENYCQTQAGLRKQWPNVFENSNPNWMKNDKLSNEYCETAGMATKELSTKEKTVAKKKISQLALDKKTT